MAWRLFSWIISGGITITRSSPGAGSITESITHSFLRPVAVTSPPIRNRTGLELDGGLLCERNCPGLGRLGEDAVTVVREGGGRPPDRAVLSLPRLVLGGQPPSPTQDCLLGYLSAYFINELEASLLI